MIPPASIPSSTALITTMPATKAKIGFSIDSIVGEDVTRSPAPKDIKAEFKYANDYQSEIARALRINESIAAGEHNQHVVDRFKPDADLDNRLPAGYFEYSHHSPPPRHPSQTSQHQPPPPHNPHQHPPHHILHHLQQHHHHHHQSPPDHQRDSSVSPPSYKRHRSSEEPPSLQRSPSVSPAPPATSIHTSTPLRSPPLRSPPLRSPRSPSAEPANHSGTSSQFPVNPTAHHPVGAPSSAGPIRPMPIVPQNLGGPDKSPAFLGLPGIGQPHHNPHMFQFQMAAALAQRHAAEQGFPPHPGAPKFGPMPPHPGMPPHLMNGGGMGREGYPLYPWLLSRHGRIFPHGFPGNFLLHPFRKPKRVRTAFSPSQLLKLEHAFESNQYVVGAERKALAQALNLSETQVKVWFQNRRTKHKRMQQEDESKGGSGSTNASNSSVSSQNQYEDELIDMDDSYSEDDSDSPQ